MNNYKRLYHFSSIRNEAGKVNLVSSFILIVLVVGVYLGYKFIPPYSTDYEFKRFLEIQTRNAFEWSEDAINKNIKEFVDENGIVLKEKDWTVIKIDNEIHIIVNYDVRVELLFNQDRILPFSHVIKEKIRPKKEL